MKDLEKTYQSLLEQQRQVEKIKRYLQDINKEVAHIEQELNFIETALRKENKDFERLHKKNFKSFFHRLKGDLYRQTEKELSDFHRQSLLYKSQLKSKELLLFEKKVLFEKLSNCNNLEQKIKNAKQQLEDRKLIDTGRQGKKIVAVSKQIGEVIIVQKELTDAIDAGKKLSAILEDMQKKYKNLKYRHTLFSYKVKEAKFKQLDNIREQLPILKLSAIKFDHEYREAYPASFDYEIFGKEKEYKNLQKALFDIRHFRGLKNGWWDEFQFYISHLTSKADTKTHSMRKRLKTLNNRLIKLNVEKERLLKTI